MIVPDANLLIYAHDETSPHHKGAKRWWEDVLSGNEPIGIPWVVVLAFTRLMTHPTVCSNPLTPAECRRRVDCWFEQVHVRLLSPTSATLKRFFDLLEEAGLGGNLSTDAMIAAQAMEHGAIVHTADLDFGRFGSLIWKNPIADSK